MIYLRLGCDFVFNSEEHKPEEVQLVVHNAMTRLKKEQILTPQKNKATNEPLCLIPNNFSVVVDGKKEVRLTKLEYTTLYFLSQKPNIAFSYEEIYEELYSDRENEVDTTKKYRVSNIIFHLRKKIEEMTSSSKYIKTVRSKGYMLDIQHSLMV